MFSSSSSVRSPSQSSAMAFVTPTFAHLPQRAVASTRVRRTNMCAAKPKGAPAPKPGKTEPATGKGKEYSAEEIEKIKKKRALMFSNRKVCIHLSQCFLICISFFLTFLPIFVMYLTRAVCTRQLKTCNLLISHLPASSPRVLRYKK